MRRQGAEMVLVGMSQQLGPQLQAVAPSLWQHIAGPLLPPGGADDGAPTAEPPTGDAQVEQHLVGYASTTESVPRCMANRGHGDILLLSIGFDKYDNTAFVLPLQHSPWSLWHRPSSMRFSWPRSSCRPWTLLCALSRLRCCRVLPAAAAIARVRSALRLPGVQPPSRQHSQTPRCQCSSGAMDCQSPPLVSAQCRAQAVKLDTRFLAG